MHDRHATKQTPSKQSKKQISKHTDNKRSKQAGKLGSKQARRQAVSQHAPKQTGKEMKEHQALSRKAVDHLMNFNQPRDR